MVSVIIVVYCGERFIKETIERVLEQTYRPEEIIVINDASTDRTEDIILKNFSKSVKYYRNERNMERCYSRNSGYSLSKGEYVFFLDHDDLWEGNHIEKTLENWGDAHIVYSLPRRLVDQKGNLIKHSKKKIPTDPNIAIYSGIIGYPSATAFKRGYYLEYIDEFMVREDWEVFLRACILGYKIKLLDTDTVMIREHASRTSKSVRLYKGTMKVYEEYHDKIPQEYLPYFLFHVGDVCMRFGNLKEGWSFLLQAIAQKPHLLLSGRNLLSILRRGIRFWR